jgi:hypothetical protein
VRTGLREEQQRCAAVQIELDAQRQVNTDILMQIEDQGALYEATHAEVILLLQHAPCTRNPPLFSLFPTIPIAKLMSSADSRSCARSGGSMS